MAKSKTPGAAPERKVLGPFCCRGCGIFSKTPICRNCQHTDRRYGTKTT